MDSVWGLHYHSIGASRSGGRFGRHIKDVTKISSCLGAHNVKPCDLPMLTLLLSIIKVVPQISSRFGRHIIGSTQISSVFGDHNVKPCDLPILTLLLLLLSLFVFVFEVCSSI